MAEQTSTWKNDSAEAYEKYLVPVLFDGYADDMLMRLQAHAPKTLLEIAAGTGAVTRRMATALTDTAIMATDLNPSMVEVGKRVVPEVQWQQADAGTLPFTDEQFDTVVCQFGVMFFPDKAGAFAEVRRVLKPGGRLLFNVWASLDDNELSRTVDDAMRTVLLENPPVFIRTIPHGYFDTDQITTDLRAGGFDNVTHEKVTIDTTSTAANLATGLCHRTLHRISVTPATRGTWRPCNSHRSHRERNGQSSGRRQPQHHCRCVRVRGQQIANQGNSLSRKTRSGTLRSLPPWVKEG